jgi:hypothetical protein
LFIHDFDKKSYLDLRNLIIENVIRLSENGLIININQYDLTKIKTIFCIEQIFDKNSKFCSISNTFNQLNPASIYNLSVSVHRDSFQNTFFWEKQTISKLVNTGKCKYWI